MRVNRDRDSWWSRLWSEDTGDEGLKLIEVPGGGLRGRFVCWWQLAALATRKRTAIRGKTRRRPIVPLHARPDQGTSCSPSREVVLRSGERARTNRRY